MFTRWKTLEKVFRQVREARPEKLYLYQDGPRADRYDEDMAGLLKCRAIVSNIDWECQVIRRYMDTNQGCDPGSYYAYKWFFTEEPKGIILEDDAVASQSFFHYCEELLDRYENDRRIYRICGTKVEGRSDTGYSYFFSRKGSTGSWASWSRVAEMWDDSYAFLDDEDEMARLKEKFESEDYFNTWLKTAKDHRDAGYPYYETIFYENKTINNMLDIIPDCNLVSNIGLTEDAVHNNSNAKMMSHALRSYFDAPRYELGFPLNHPPEVTENMHYLDSINKMMGWGHPFIRYARTWESRVKRLIYGGREEHRKLIKAVLRKIGLKRQ